MPLFQSAFTKRLLRIAGALWTPAFISNLQRRWAESKHRFSASTSDTSPASRMSADSKDVSSGSRMSTEAPREQQRPRSGPEIDSRRSLPDAPDAITHKTWMKHSKIIAGDPPDEKLEASLKDVEAAVKAHEQGREKYQLRARILSIELNSAQKRRQAIETGGDMQGAKQAFHELGRTQMNVILSMSNLKNLLKDQTAEQSVAALLAKCIDQTRQYAKGVGSFERMVGKLTQASPPKATRRGQRSPYSPPQDSLKLQRRTPLALHNALNQARGSITATQPRKLKKNPRR